MGLETGAGFGRGYGRGCGFGVAPDAAFKHREPIDNLLDRIVDRLDRIPRAALAGLDLVDLALERIHHRRNARRTAVACAATAAAGLLDMNQQVGEPTLDGIEMREAGIGGIEPLHQRGDAILEMAERGVVGVGELNPFELFDQAGDQPLELARNRMASFVRSVKHVGKRIDAVFQRRQRIAACRHVGDVVDPGREPADIFGDFRQRVVRGHMVEDAAQCADRLFKLLQRRRVVIGGDDIDLARQRRYRILDADQAFRRGEAAQRLAHFGQTVFEACERGTVDAGSAGCDRCARPAP